MSGRVIRVAPHRVREPASAPAADTVRQEASAPVAPTRAAEPVVPVVNVSPPVVNMDTTELARQFAANNELLRQVLAELRRKKKWQFDLVRDAMGRPSQIDANEA